MLFHCYNSIQRGALLSLNIFILQGYFNWPFSSSSISVFILGFSHFDINLFRHLHFRFIIVSVTFKQKIISYTKRTLHPCKENSARQGRFLLFSLEISFRKTVNFLHIKWIWKSLYVDFDAYKNFDLSRQTIKFSNTTLELLEIKSKYC